MLMLSKELPSRCTSSAPVHSPRLQDSQTARASYPNRYLILPSVSDLFADRQRFCRRGQTNQDHDEGPSIDT